MTGKHGDQDESDGIHKIRAWTWASAAARLSQAVSSVDEHKFGYQSDTDEYYELTVYSPVTWVMRFSGATANPAVTLSGTLEANLLGITGQNLELDGQGANEFFSGPSTGGGGTPSFRPIVAADLPHRYEDTPSTVGSGVFVLQTILHPDNTTANITTTIIARQTGGTAGTVGNAFRTVAIQALRRVSGSQFFVGIATVVALDKNASADIVITFTAGGADIQVVSIVSTDEDYVYRVTSEVVFI